MKLFAFKRRNTGTLAELYHLVDEIYLVEYGCESPVFVGSSIEEMHAIIKHEHDYVINDIDIIDEYDIIEFEAKPKLIEGNCVGTP
ncbi:hypothetical protein JNMOADIG_00024 [Aeromonas phage avDM5]|uniref:Uncharacterized protein n=1 Tax=Aeromonas phage vB_AehM_DM2 TaxID=2973716 RepID=A0AA95C4B6_9CAUD|nr:hypothetical protein JNMOADIG_00024 [Aeromonas phage avDM5]UYD60473.1 hypothetical protein NPHMPGLK_00138 [Aeromonas phage avDM2]UYD60691.1 hypothetical protein NHNEHLNL_00095 [Aeromonas phage avDM2]